MHHLLPIAIQASLAASRVIMDIYKRDYEMAYKSDQSPLTEADRAANSVIM